MSVELSPSSQLGFHRPLTMLVKRTLSVHNTNSQPVAFKVKTTAPKQYCVRPNSGRIEPGERVEVQVLLQPMKEEPAPGTKCRDKFLVQSAVITPDREVKTLQELWSAIEAEVKAGHEGVIHEQKIRCAYLPPVDEMDGSNGPPTSGTSVTQFGTPGNFTTNGTPPPYESRKGSTDVGNDTVDRSMSKGADSPNAVDAKENQGDVTAPLDSIPSSIPKSTQEAKAVASNAATAVTSAAAGAAASLGLTSAAGSSSTTGSTRAIDATTSSTSSSDVSSLQKELAAARAEIEKLRELVKQKENEASSGLRQRNVAGTDSKPTSGSIAGTQTATITQEGIPLPMVAAIAGGVFFFTWLFL